jgi:hypothetical protein
MKQIGPNPSGLCMCGCGERTRIGNCKWMTRKQQAAEARKKRERRVA